MNVKLPQVATFVLLVGLAIGYWLFSDSFSSNESAAEAESSAEEDPASSGVVILNDEKRQQAGIVTTQVTRADVPTLLTLPGRFTYDDRRHVATRASFDGLLTQVLVSPGDQVVRGDLLATMRCPELGKARSEVIRLQSELEVAEAESEWRSSLCSGVESLVKGIKSGQTVSSIEANAVAAKLGQYRERLLAGYSAATLASRLANTAEQSQGAISGRAKLQRQSEQQQAQAALDAIIEESLFETAQLCRAATGVAETAQRDLQLAKLKLANLLGVPLEVIESQAIDNMADLSELKVLAAIDGSVESHRYSATERVSQGDELFVIADTSVLWLEAEIRGKDWSATAVQPGSQVRIVANANDDEIYEGQVHYIGREVDPNSGAVPLVIEVANPGGRLRPGLFARAEVTVGMTRDAIVVPESSVIDIEGSASVFVEVVSVDGGYRATPVEPGARNGAQIEIRNGLDARERVVSTGAFFLKSELLLEGEE